MIVKEIKETNHMNIDQLLYVLEKSKEKTFNIVVHYYISSTSFNRGRYYVNAVSNEVFQELKNKGSTGSLTKFAYFYQKKVISLTKFAYFYQKKVISLSVEKLLAIESNYLYFYNFGETFYIVSEDFIKVNNQYSEIDEQLTEQVNEY